MFFRSTKYANEIHAQCQQQKKMIKMYFKLANMILMLNLRIYFPVGYCSKK